MNYTTYCIIGLITHSLSAFCDAQKTTTLPQPQAPFTIIVQNMNSNDNNNSNHATVSTPAPQEPKSEKTYKRCYPFFGKELADCMACLPSQDFNKALVKMNRRQREAYVAEISTSISALKKCKQDCTADTWASLKTQDPTCISTIESALQADDKQGKDSAQGVLGCTLICIILGICCG